MLARISVKEFSIKIIKKSLILKQTFLSLLRSTSITIRYLNLEIMTTSKLTSARKEEIKVEMLSVVKYWLREQVGAGKTEQEIKDLYATQEVKELILSRHKELYC